MDGDDEDELSMIASAIYVVLATRLKKHEDGGPQLYLKVENCMYATTERNVIPHDDNIDSILRSTSVVSFHFIHPHKYMPFARQRETTRKRNEIIRDRFLVKNPRALFTKSRANAKRA